MHLSSTLILYSLFLKIFLGFREKKFFIFPVYCVGRKNTVHNQASILLMENSDDVFVFDIIPILFPIDFPIWLQVQILVSKMYNDRHKYKSLPLVNPTCLTNNGIFFCAFFGNVCIFVKL